MPAAAALPRGLQRPAALGGIARRVLLATIPTCRSLPYWSSMTSRTFASSCPSRSSVWILRRAWPARSRRRSDAEGRAFRPLPDRHAVARRRRPGSGESDPAYSATVPVAVITAHGNMETAVRALKLGAFDFVSKPLDLVGFAQIGGDRHQAIGFRRWQDTSVFGPRSLGARRPCTTCAR